MKIIFVITGLGLGGAERVVSDLADQMFSKGHQVKIAYLTGPIVTKPKSNSIEIIYLGLESLMDFPKASIKYRKLVKRFKPDIIHSHMVHANIFTRLNRIVSKVPRLICSAHSNNEGGKYRMLAYRLTHHLADYTTNVSKNACDSFIKLNAIPNNDIHVMYNGIDFKKFMFNIKDNIHHNCKKNLIAIGRFHDAKDYPNLIKAYSIVLKNCNNLNVHLKIVGQTDEFIYPKVQKLIYENNLENKIQIMGKRDDIPQLLSQADFLILSSKYEGFGLVIAEAMACGCFVIATDCGGTAEIMGNTGILVPPQDKRALALAIQQAFSLNTQAIVENNKKARKRIEDLFSLEKSVEKWLEIYEQ